MEFVLLVSFMLLIFFSFFLVFQNKLVELTVAQDTQYLKEANDVVISEIKLAQKMYSDYERNFTLTSFADAAYQLSLSDRNEITSKYNDIEYVNFLSVNISGNFFDSRFNDAKNTLYRTDGVIRFSDGSVYEDSDYAVFSANVNPETCYIASKNFEVASDYSFCISLNDIYHKNYTAYCRDNFNIICPICGDGYLDSGEECDKELTPDTCNSDCKSTVEIFDLCGNDVVNNFEACDGITDKFGNYISECSTHDTQTVNCCSDACQLATNPYYVDPNPVATCGDGVYNPSVEYCDASSLNSPFGSCDSASPGETCCMSDCTQGVIPALSQSQLRQLCSDQGGTWLNGGFNGDINNQCCGDFEGQEFFKQTADSKLCCDEESDCASKDGHCIEDGNFGLDVNGKLAQCENGNFLTPVQDSETCDVPSSCFTEGGCIEQFEYFSSNSNDYVCVSAQTKELPNNYDCFFSYECNDDEYCENSIYGICQTASSCNDFNPFWSILAPDFSNDIVNNADLYEQVTTLWYTDLSDSPQASACCPPQSCALLGSCYEKNEVLIFGENEIKCKSSGEWVLN